MVGAIPSWAQTLHLDLNLGITPSDAMWHLESNQGWSHISQYLDPWYSLFNPIVPNLQLPDGPSEYCGLCFIPQFT